MFFHRRSEALSSIAFSRYVSRATSFAGGQGDDFRPIGEVWPVNSGV
jgi:hypothetical protein